MAYTDYLKREFSRKLRRNQTESEKVLWDVLRAGGFKQHKFRRQHVIGPYIADFCSLTCRLIIELDGARHRLDKQRDRDRTRYLNRKGFNVIRFWDDEVIRKDGETIERIVRALTLPSPTFRGRG